MSFLIQLMMIKPRRHDDLKTRDMLIHTHSKSDYTTHDKHSYLSSMMFSLIQLMLVKPRSSKVLQQIEATFSLISGIQNDIILNSRNHQTQNKDENEKIINLY